MVTDSDKDIAYGLGLKAHSDDITDYVLANDDMFLLCDGRSNDDISELTGMFVMGCQRALKTSEEKLAFTELCGKLGL